MLPCSGITIRSGFREEIEVYPGSKLFSGQNSIQFRVFCGISYFRSDPFEIRIFRFECLGHMCAVISLVHVIVIT